MYECYEYTVQLGAILELYRLPLEIWPNCELPHPTKYLEHGQHHSQCILSLSAAFTLSGWLDKKTGLDEADATNDEGRVRPIVLQ